jgi:tRNA-2-methylthio-N6-dimethylallyladenosine synthase
VSRALPVLDLVAPPAVGAGARLPSAEADPRVAEFLTDDVVLPRFHVWTLGCQMNHSDSEEMAGSLLAAGCAEASSLESAELIVINSCAIREAAEQKVIGRMGVLGRLKAANPQVRVVLTGCSVRADNAGALRRRYPAVDLFLRPDEEPDLTARLGLAGATSPGAAPTYQRVGRSVAATADGLPLTRAAAVASGAIAREGLNEWSGAARTAWLPIIYGCDKTCTYCIVPFSRGPERSRPFDDVVAEARLLATDGVQEVTLLGQNVNSYGHDLPAETRFADVRGGREIGRALALDGRPDIAALLRAIDGIRTADGVPAIPRVRFVTSHPWDLTDRLISAMAECSSVCEHLHLPVQSGDDAVLRRMGRQYRIDEYLSLVERLRAAIPGIALTTDVIVGFCETEAQFESTLDLLRTVRYDQVFAAAFSVRPGTPAARLPDDVPPAEKRRRLNALLELQEEIGLSINQGWVGRSTEVLVERVETRRSHDHEDGAPVARVSGRNREHKLVHLEGDARLVGARVTVVIEGAGPYSLTGRRSA